MLDVTGSINENINGDVGSIFGSVNGDINGNVYGNVFGSINGNVHGNVYGDVIGSINGDVEGRVHGRITGIITGLINGAHHSNNNRRTNINWNVNNFNGQSFQSQQIVYGTTDPTDDYSLDDIEVDNIFVPNVNQVNAIIANNENLRIGQIDENLNRNQTYQTLINWFSLVKTPAIAIENKVEASNYTNDPNDNNNQACCPICLDSINDLRRKNKQVMSTLCGHIVCETCTQVLFRNKTTIECPYCSKKLKKKDVHALFL